jgi:D-threo-aldose 1-dehydrogenase
VNIALKRPVGRTPVHVTQLGMGGTAFGNMYSAVSEQAALDTFFAGYRAGIRYFDTAPLYGHGRSEIRLGVGLSQVPREEVVISTKVGYTLEPRRPEAIPQDVFADPLPMATRYDYSRDAVLRSLETSLQRLGTDHVEIVLIHDPDESTSIKPGVDHYERSHFSEVMAGAYPALHELRSQSVVKAIGLGMNQWQMLADFAQAGDFDCFLLAGRYTLLEQAAAQTLLPLCVQRGIGVVIGGPFNSGILATGAVPGAYYNYAPAPPHILQRTREIEAVCARYDVPLPAAALQFPFGHPAVVSVIPGARSTGEVEANVRYFQRAIAPDFWLELRALGLVDRAARLPTQES